MKCKSCGGEMIQRNRPRMFAVGLAMVASPAVAYLVPLFLLPAIFLTLVGAYLLVWAAAGQGRWCRNCKKFSLF
jgi:hypothetical protein